MRSAQILALSLTLPWVVACSGQEQLVLSTFFGALERGDENAARAVSLAEFPSEVQSWEIVEVGPPSKEPFMLADLRARFLEAESELEEVIEENEAFLQEHQSAYEAYRQRLDEDPEHEFSGELAEFQAGWEARMKEQKELSAKVEELRSEIRALRSAAGLSLNTSVNENFNGEVTGKELQLRIHDGSEEKTYTFRLERYELVDTERNIEPIARWIITDIQEVEA